MRFPTTAQFDRLTTLGVTDAERALLSQRGHDHAYIQDLIQSAARWPLGSGGLRHYRLFHEFPRGARSINALGDADRDALTAWRHLDTLRSNLDTINGCGKWALLYGVGELADQLTELARNGHADAARNSAIEQRIQEGTVLLAGYLTAARQDGRLTGADYAAYAEPVPEWLRRSGRAWRALAKRQRERLEARRALRQLWRVSPVSW
jgi:hypothetical protein